jgi:aryl-alcohol dehydrogenase-like predicted oxidoreductase
MKLMLGTAQFGMQYGIANNIGQPNQDVIKEILNAALTDGIDMLDTAAEYGDSEERLGMAGVADWKIVSKFSGYTNDFLNQGEDIRKNFLLSLQKLKVNNIYGLLLHRPNLLMQKNGDNLYRCLRLLKEEGLVKKIGISIYDPETLDGILSRFDFDLVQAPLNPIDQRLISSGWASRLSSMGIELHVRSIFLQGLLLMDKDQRPAYFDKWSKTWSIWNDWLNDSGASAIQACIGFANNHSEVDRIIVGIESKGQLLEIVSAMQNSILKLPMNLSSIDVGLINPGNWNIDSRVG